MQICQKYMKKYQILEKFICIHLFHDIYDTTSKTANQKKIIFD